jgi:predicted amidohydrolase
MRQLRLGIAQINTAVGDSLQGLPGITLEVADGSALGVDLLTFTELTICGYPPEDLLLKPEFTEGCP